MLYRIEDHRWKITDFGLCTEGTSGRAHTTRYARGTASYRSPELLNNSGYNNKVDIWALGCIFYELVGRKQAFSSDYNVLQYVSSGGGADELNPLTLPVNFSRVGQCVVMELVHAMLQVDAPSRPSTRNILEILPMGLMAPYVKLSVWIANCQHGLSSSLPQSKDRRGASYNKIYLDPASPLWSSVKWRRRW